MSVLSNKTKENIKRVYENKGFKVFFNDERRVVTIAGTKKRDFSYDIFCL